MKLKLLKRESSNYYFFDIKKVHFCTFEVLGQLLATKHQFPPSGDKLSLTQTLLKPVPQRTLSPRDGNKLKFLLQT